MFLLLLLKREITHQKVLSFILASYINGKENNKEKQTKHINREV